MRWVYLTGAIVTEVTATMSLRAGVDHPAWIALAVLGYVSAFALLALTLRAGTPVGAAYGIWGALGVAATAVLGSVLFDEHLSAAAIAGIGLITVGVALVETGSHTPAEPEQPEVVR